MAQIRAKPSISSHGLFPAIVAIWFAALFGLGCLVLPAVLFERVAYASGIARWVPAAAPPLGMTARLAISCGAGLFGAVLGFAIARRVAGVQPAERPARPARQPRLADGKSIRRPISAKEELDADPLGPPVPDRVAVTESAAEDVPAVSPHAPLPGRRRSLTPAQEPQASAFLPTVPPPMHWVDEQGDTPPDESTALEAPVFSQDFAPSANDSFEHQAPHPAEADAQSGCEAVPAEAPAEPARAGQSAPRRGPAIAEPLRALLAGKLRPVDKVAGPLELLGMVELAERLGRSMNEHQAPRTSAAGFAALLEPEPAARQAPVENAPLVSPAPPPAAMPAALRPFAPSPDEYVEEEDEDEFLPAGYGSLLGQAAPAAPAAFRPTATRAFDAPPEAAGRAPNDGEKRNFVDTEQALRSALETLQRIRGTA